ncbi:uncharacterized protein LOC114126985 [Aphis gossypii]|uniref:F-box domain-containing protein n=1 Tax=Aphis gossypii TaxID=80765 RepID=A0A9P0ISY0_APHGO|nr:uncharacterized protein LOC114126985 [Aphis gossypii]XP_027846857.2 uncharacterized protein LOC114126985 [Aphis gossypii]CAH1711576.1 unnamed protein product [Aphis gossypii]
MENSNKRPLEDECQYLHTETKKPKASQVASTTSHPKSSKEIVGIEDLCDDIIVYLYKFLTHDDLAKMALVSRNLFRISCDWTLWKKPKFEQYDKSMEYLYFAYLKNTTTEIHISYDDVQSPGHSVSHNFLMQLETMCPELEHLTLRNQIFDANEINVRVLHRKLKSLTIDNTTIENIPDSSSYLCGINNSCPDLEKVIMTNNDWFLPNCLYALAKLERLRYLSLAGCKQFKDCIPYASITAITGFKSLHTLDLRFTPISDHELVCFQRLTSLKSVLLESPSYMNHERDATITDLGLAGFCTVAFEFHYPYIQILIDRRGGVNLRRVQDRHGDLNRCNIETLCVRNYPKVTDAFLKTAARNCPHLKSLDITGSCCTLEEIEYYKASRPRTKVIS